MTMEIASMESEMGAPQSRTDHGDFGQMRGLTVQHGTVRAAEASSSD